MLIKLALDAVLGILQVLFGWLHFPEIGGNLEAFVVNLCYYISGAMKFVFVFVNRQLVVALIGIMLALIGLAKTWDLIWWIMGKVPFLGVTKE